MELELLQPWTATGGFLTVASSNDPSVIGCVLQMERARLVLPLTIAPNSQYVAGAASEKALGFTVPGASESSDAYELTPAGLRPLPHRRVTGGIRVALEDGTPCLIVLTQDPQVISSLSRRLNKTARRAAQLQRLLAASSLEQTEQINERLSQQARSIGVAQTGIAAARAMLTQCDELLGRGEFRASYLQSGRCLEALRRIQRSYWEQAAKDDLVRVGKQWMPRPDAEKLKDDADKLVAEAIELIKLDNFAKADTKLERASKIYPDHLESLFLLGLGALLTDDVKGAEKRFSQCLARAPNHVPLLNNAALSAALSKKYDRAVKLWEKAAAVDPENPAIAQNLGQFIADAAKGKSLAKAARTKAEADAARGRVTGKIQIDFANVDKRVVNDAQEIYARLVAGGKVPRSDPARGYTVLKLFQEKKGGSDDRSSPEESQVVGNGSGFVIWDGFVLTNRHVVENADAVVIQDPANPSGEPLGGMVVAVSKELDLAIVECRPLKAPAVPIASAEVSRGTEVLALGFPVMSVVGKGLKATRGIVTGLPSKDTGNLMVLDVQINPGNSGGPLCDKSGRVMGIVAAKTFTERFVQGYGLAIPMSDAVAFVKKSIPGFSQSEATDKKLEWTEVDAGISKSTVLVLIKKKRKVEAR
jgi:S1-C subfamily serine protease